MNSDPRSKEPMEKEATEISPKESVLCQELYNGTICNSKDIDADMLPFGEHVCRRCKIYSPLYQLMSKKQIQAEYLLTDDSLSMMSFVTKPNPYNPNWTAMKMYLRKHAYLKAMKRFGDEEALKKEIERRKQEQYQRALNQSEDLFTESSSSLDSTRKRKSGDASGDKSLDDEKNDDDGLSKKKKKVKKTRQKMAGLISAISGK